VSERDERDERATRILIGEAKYTERDARNPPDASIRLFALLWKGLKGRGEGRGEGEGDGGRRRER